MLGVEGRLMAVITGKSSCGRVWNVSTNRFQSELNSGACSPLISPSREKWAGLFGAELFSLSTLIQLYGAKFYPCFCPLLHLGREAAKNLAISIPWSIILSTDRFGVLVSQKPRIFHQTSENMNGQYICSYLKYLPNTPNTNQKQTQYFIE